MKHKTKKRKKKRNMKVDLFENKTEHKQSKQCKKLTEQKIMIPRLKKEKIYYFCSEMGYIFPKTACFHCKKRGSFKVKVEHFEKLKEE